MHSLSGGVDNKTKGFTLLELMIVLFIMVLGFSVVGINLSSGNDATALKRLPGILRLPYGLQEVRL